MSAPSIYLDYAATAARRPDEVGDAVATYFASGGATPGRGTHQLAIEAGRMLLRCRQTLARLVNIPGDAGRIAFTFNATHALNAAIHGTVAAGDTVVVTDLDHNSVLRTAHHAARQRGAVVRHVAARADGSLEPDAFDSAVRGAKLVCLNAASNVLGTLLDLPPLVRRAKEHGALVLVDAAQIAGHAPFDVAASGADMVAFTGHKALLGPQGTGALWVRAGVEVEAWMAGGTGGNSASREMPAAFPDRIEAGSVNAPGIAGLAAALHWLETRTIDALASAAARHRDQMYRLLARVPGICVRTTRTESGLPIVCFTPDRLDPGAFAARLDRDYGVLTRAGLHCAPEAHRVIGTLDTGAVRLSAGWATTEQELERAVAAIHDVAGGGTAARNEPGLLPSKG